MSKLRSQGSANSLEMIVWEKYRAAALAMKERPTPANERAVSFYRLRFLAEATKEG